MGDELAVYKLDRIARSTTELLNLIEALIEKGVAIKLVNEKWADTSTPAGKAMITVMAEIAEFERDLIRQRSSDGREATIKRGVKFGRPKKLSRDQVGLIFDALDNGASVKQLAQSFSVGRDAIYRLIKESTQLSSKVINAKKFNFAQTRYSTPIEGGATSKYSSNGDQNTRIQNWKCRVLRISKKSSPERIS